ncbi:Serine/threonine-protein kinase TEL1 [Gossypium arboreum]|uniref:Serine/threonine-protein kinase TEL1 n=1 Tax=Gossypium arboreum TaxID=29729 RepID=A0A0B0MAK7_GOSAR|nr:Serine/threonine-protein kinase TEL1 [Gossypium arboreum]KHG14237.1 Serine/threonine-protein kinase TEL1 [Gossypium arboreum]
MREKNHLLKYYCKGDSRRFWWLGLLSWIRISADTHLCTDDHEIVSFTEISASTKVPRSEMRPEITVLDGRERDKLLDNALMVVRQCALMASIWGVEQMLPEASRS